MRIDAQGYPTKTQSHRGKSPMLQVLSDSDGVKHNVWSQQQSASCGVAAIWMASCLARRQTMLETEWGRALRLYNNVVSPHAPDYSYSPSAPVSFAPALHEGNQKTVGNTFSAYGLHMHQVVQGLANDGVRSTYVTPPLRGLTIDSSRLQEGRPAICMLGWYRFRWAIDPEDRWDRVGGHFVVAARLASNGLVVYLDSAPGVLKENAPQATYGTTGQFEQFAYLTA